MSKIVPINSEKKLDFLEKEKGLVYPLSIEAQSNTKGGCNCNEKRIKRVPKPKSTTTVRYY